LNKLVNFYYKIETLILGISIIALLIAGAELFGYFANNYFNFKLNTTYFLCGIGSLIGIVIGVIFASIIKFFAIKCKDYLRGQENIENRKMLMIAVKEYVVKFKRIESN